VQKHPPARRRTHLRLLLDPSEEARLADVASRARAEWAHLQSFADHAPPYDSFEIGHKPLAGMGLAYLVTHDRRCGELISARMEAALGSPDWTYPTHRAARLTVSLATAHQMAEIAWACNWLRDYLSSEQRTRWQEALVARGLAPFLRAHRDDTEWWAREPTNWRTVICGEMGLAALAVLDDWPPARESLRESLVGVLATLDANPADGSYVEGLDYWSYGVGPPGLRRHCARVRMARSICSGTRTSDRPRRSRSTSPRLTWVRSASATTPMRRLRPSCWPCSRPGPTIRTRRNWRCGCEPGILWL